MRQCYDAPTCLERVQSAPSLTSNVGLHEFITIGGIFDAEQTASPLATANKAYGVYCSSDAWVGDTGTESNDFNFQFRGQRSACAFFGTPPPVLT